MMIRKAKISDAKEISDFRIKTIEKICFKDYTRKQIKLFKKKHSEKEIIKRIKNREMFCLIDNKKIIGTISLYNKNTIADLYLRKEYIKKSLGKKLIKFIENYAKKKGVKKLKAYSTITAMDFYKKRGYELKENFFWRIFYLKLKIPFLVKDPKFVKKINKKRK